MLSLVLGVAVGCHRAGPSRRAALDRLIREELPLGSDQSRITWFVESIGATSQMWWRLEGEQRILEASLWGAQSPPDFLCDAVGQYIMTFICDHAGKLTSYSIDERYGCA